MTTITIAKAIIIQMSIDRPAIVVVGLAVAVGLDDVCGLPTGVKTG
jgi:hypothetical protein